MSAPIVYTYQYARRRAKRIKKLMGISISHTAALDKAAQECGYLNWAKFLKHVAERAVLKTEFKDESDV